MAKAYARSSETLVVEGEGYRAVMILADIFEVVVFD